MILFFLFFVIILLGFNIIITKNPIIAVISLIMVYIFTSIIMIFLGAEFLGIVLIVIYAGAISVLFLFIVMMLNIRLLSVYNMYYMHITHIPIGFFVCILFMIQFCFIILHNLPFLNLYIFEPDIYNYWVLSCIYETDLKLIGILLLNYNSIYLIIASFILLLGMVGSISLTLDTYTQMPSTRKNIINYRFQNEFFY